jgi:hypothetical protein
MIIGDPDEGGRLDQVASTLLGLGYQIADDDWMLGGSQEISIYRFTRGQDRLVLQVETYNDLKLFGTQKLLDEARGLAMPGKDEHQR